MELGISTWSVPWSIGVPGYPQPSLPLDAPGLIAKAVSQRVRLVQIADNLPLHECSSAELDRISQEAVAHGVALEIGTRGLATEHISRYIEIAAQLGARALRTVLAGSMWGEDELVRAEAAIRQVLRQLEQQNVKLALENNETFSAAQFAELMRRISSPVVGICLDTANSLGRPEPLEAVVAQLGAYTVMLHAKDYDIKRVDNRMGFSVIGRPAGDGRVDFQALLRGIRDPGRNEMSVIVEHWPPFEGSIEATVKLEEEWLSQSVAFLRGLIPDGTKEQG